MLLKASNRINRSVKPFLSEAEPICKGIQARTAASRKGTCAHIQATSYERVGRKFPILIVRANREKAD